MRSWRGTAIGVAAALLALTSAASSSSAAQAYDDGHSGPVVCLGGYRTSWTPGLTLLTRPTRISTAESYACTGGIPSTAGKAAGSFDGVLPASCVGLNGSPVNEVVRYVDGGMSEIAYTTAIRGRAGAASLNTLLGRVVRGRYTGRPAVRTAQLLHQELPTACLSPDGLQHGAGLAELVIS
ncbi:hypothetical protein ABZ769_23655 [Streptomyces olivoreticuli]